MVFNSDFHVTKPDAVRIQVYLYHNNITVLFSNTKIDLQEYILCYMTAI